MVVLLRDASEFVVIAGRGEWSTPGDIAIARDQFIVARRDGEQTWIATSYANFRTSMTVEEVYTAFRE